MIHEFAVAVVEGRETRDHLVDQRSQRPPVYRLAVRLLLDDLGSQVLGRSAEGENSVSLNVFFRQTEVGDTDVTLWVKKQVLRF